MNMGEGSRGEELPSNGTHTAFSAITFDVILVKILIQKRK